MQPDRPGGDAYQYRNIQVLIPFGFYDVAGAGFTDAKIRAIGVENDFRLQENRVADAEPGAELRTEFQIIDIGRKYNDQYALSLRILTESLEKIKLNLFSGSRILFRWL